ncbi:hypothetical protein [Flaviaesturariibacter terrae]
MKIVFLSGCTAALPSLGLLQEQGHSLTLLCPASAEGRSAREEARLLETWAAEHGVPNWPVAASDLDGELRELIRETDPDLVLSFGFAAAIQPQLLEPVRHGGWNVHIRLSPAANPLDGFEGCISLGQWRGDHRNDLLLERRCGIPIDEAQPMEELGRQAALLLGDALLRASGIGHLLGWRNGIA